MKKFDYAIDVVRSSADLVGESPLWNPEERALYWVDTRRPCIQRLGPDGAWRAWPMPGRLGSIALCRSGGLVAGTQRGFCRFDPQTGQVTTIVDPEAATPKNRLNDGKIDRRGRYWCVSCGASEDDPGGSLFRLDPDLSCHRIDGGFITGNGLAISPDDRTMVVGDTHAEVVYAYDFDLDAGRVSNRRVFFTTRNMPWFTDGGTFDAEGYYWCALVYGGCLGRFDPRGRLDRLIRLPTSAPTMCNFGGEDLDILYVTTGSILLPEEQRSRELEAGWLFAIRNLGVRGVPEPWFAG
jgi:sugar lactone lactonase YvrE